MKNIVYSVLKKTIKNWLSGNPLTYSAASAYFAVLSLPGLLIITIYIAAFFLNETFVKEQIEFYMGQFMGGDVAVYAREIIQSTRLESSATVPLIIGSIIILFGASGLFNQIKTTLNTVWELKDKTERRLLQIIAKRLVSLVVAILMVFCILALIYMSVCLRMIQKYSAFQLANPFIIIATGLSVKFFSLTLIFTLIFKVLPDIHIKLRYAGMAGILSAALFLTGEWGVTHILSQVFSHNVFGAAGALVLIMIWVTYGCMILQFSAEFIRVIMQEFDEQIETTHFVEKIETKYKN